ncbi:diguanylate cyclase domain-containing protein [Shewanella gelidii]|uniref:Diguanylate cyclase n=1 Tax=Shewanella gelidii TaxID=1642821 RepID=A0A917JL39_9GAMM|nr:diguanylate cyclase [Shewanella gelidii]MCL1097474.1 diguanylate cyclase [Shewanella gelidii]GGI75520.1 diguanylate cyclase [Shewanella gelidii]
MIFSFSNSGFRDPETGVYNLTYFMEVFHREWYSHLRDGQGLALLYLCPHIHETHNQPHLLEFFTKHVQQSLLRRTDLIARVNQNRFAVGLFNIDSSGVEKVLNRIDEEIAKFNQEFGKQQSMQVDYKIVACICLPKQKTQIESLFSAADEHLINLERTSDDHRALYTLAS